MRRRLSRVPVTVVYAALLVVVTVTLAALGPAELAQGGLQTLG